MERKLINIWVIKLVQLTLLFMLSHSCLAQYTWGYSSNYLSIQDRQTYTYFYIIKAEFKSPWIYYEMGKRGNVDTLSFYVTDNNCIPQPLYYISLSFDDTRDTIIKTNKDGYVTITCSKDTRFISISIFHLENKLHLPLSIDKIPKTTTIVIGKKPSNHYLNIFSKKSLTFSDIKNIKDLAANGNTIDEKDFFYYFSDTPSTQ